jgi:hypothetical protein
MIKFKNEFLLVNRVAFNNIHFFKKVVLLLVLAGIYRNLYRNSPNTENTGSKDLKIGKGLQMYLFIVFSRGLPLNLNYTGYTTCFCEYSLYFRYYNPRFLTEYAQSGLLKYLKKSEKNTTNYLLLRIYQYSTRARIRSKID